MLSYYNTFLRYPDECTPVFMKAKTRQRCTMQAVGLIERQEGFTAV